MAGGAGAVIGREGSPPEDFSPLFLAVVEDYLVG